VEEEHHAGRDLGLDALLVLQYLLHHPEIDTITAAMVCQRPEAQIRERLSTMEKAGYVEHGGTGRGAYWTLHPELYRRLAQTGHPERDRRIDWEAAKTRILSILMERAKRGDVGLSNSEIRHITHYDRYQVKRLMKELMHENPQLQPHGRGRNITYRIVNTAPELGMRNEISH